MIIACHKIKMWGWDVGLIEQWDSGGAEMANDKAQMTNESKNDKSNKKYDIRDRSLEFAARSAALVGRLPRTQAAYEYGKQLIRSSASIGANLEEADGTLSRKDFINKLAIARREARESRYWLTLIGRVGLISDLCRKEELASLTKEAKELMLIISSIINKTKARG
ncbi:four helix bundle protein [Candidatus Margulisiibacteriota bacterium]